MKMKIFGSAVAVLALFSIAGTSNAQMMGNYYNTAPSSYTATTSAEVAAGEAVWNKLAAKQVTCSQLTDSDFDSLGDYFMGRMMGASYSNMDQWMTQSFGEQGSTQMHVAMGKRISGCDTSAPYPQGGASFFPLMGMMGGWGSGYYNQGYGMMGYGYNGWGTMGGVGVLGLLMSAVALVVLVLVGVWLWQQITKK